MDLLYFYLHFGRRRSGFLRCALHGTGHTVKIDSPKNFEGEAATAMIADTKHNKFGESFTYVGLRILLSRAPARLVEFDVDIDRPPPRR